MAETVKHSRSYVSPRRKEQAAATRQTILQAARRLFERDGYTATSMPMVAAEAGVALKTVYLAFGTKAELLRTIWNRRLAGDEAAVPVLERAWYQEVRADDSPRAKLRLVARQSGSVKGRTGRLLMVIRAAAAADNEINALWEEIEAKLHQVSRAVIDQLAAGEALRPDLDPCAAADVLWTLNHPSTWHLLVVQRGWSDQAYQTWLEQALLTQLLP